MKRIFISLCITIMILTACSSNEVVPQTGEKNPETDFQTEYSDLTLNAHPMVEVKDGYYMLVGGFIYYVDKETMDYTPLCNKPNCLHQKESDPMKVGNCNAMIRIMESYICLNYYKQHLYIASAETTWEGDSTEQKYVMNRFPLDGGEREIIYEFEKPVDMAIVHRGYIYYSSDCDFLGSEAAGVYRISIDGGEEETLYVSESNKNQLSHLKIIENDLVFTEYDDKEEDCLWKYNLEKEEVQKVSFGEGINVFYGQVARDRIYYSCQESGTGKEITMSTKLDGSDLRQEDFVSHHYDKDYHYELDWNSGIQTAYDWETEKEVAKFERWRGLGVFIAGEERLFWISRDDDDGIDCFYIDREDIEKGDSAVKAFIELSPDEVDPAIITVKE